MVDDDPAFQRFVFETLSADGFSVLCLRTAEEALRLTSRHKPRAVIIDGLLPGLRGDELALRLRKAFPGQELPLIFISAFFRDLKSRTHLTRVCGVDVVLHKPVSPEELRRAIARFPSLAPRPLDPEVEVELEIDFEPAPELIAEYLALSADRIRAMRVGLASVDGPNGAAAIRSVHTEAHRFHGSGGSYGFPEISRLGAQIEVLLTPALVSGKLGAATRARVIGDLATLSEKVSRSAFQAAMPINSEAADRPLRLLVVDGPGEFALSCEEAALQGQPVRFFPSPDAALASAVEQTPDAVFVAEDLPGHNGLDVAARFVRAGLRPVVLLTRYGAQSERLEAVRRGIHGHLFRLPDAASLFRAARQLVGPPLVARVLAMDGDHALLGKIAELLAAHQLNVEPCPQPAAFFAALERTSPGLVLLDVDASTDNALDLLRALRADPQHRRRPVIALSSSDDWPHRREAFEAGADDFLAKPFAQDELVYKVRVHLARFLREEQEGARDRLSGAFTAEHLRDACEQALRLGRRGRTLALLVFEADLAALRAMPGQRLADEADLSLASRLHRAFRTTDVIARLGEGRYGVLVYDVSLDDARRLMQSNLDAFRSASFGPGLAVRVQGGLSSFPEVSGSAEALLEAALEALKAGRSERAVQVVKR